MKRVWFGCPACGLQEERWPNAKLCSKCGRGVLRIGNALPDEYQIVVIAAEMALVLTSFTLLPGCPPGLARQGMEALERYHKAVS